MHLLEDLLLLLRRKNADLFDVVRGQFGLKLA